MPGKLYIVATPIGNLEDITFRAVRILKEVDLIAAEDTRHSKKLLTHFGINTPLTSYHDHNENLKTEQLLEKLNYGTNIALITDAGTPCIADPGYRIVQAAINAEIDIIPVPGPSALIAAISASGLPTDRFAFEGFLPPKSGKRIKVLEELKSEQRTLIFYEAPHRLQKTLKDMSDIFGARKGIIARELTKIHEEFNYGTFKELFNIYNNQKIKGEIVILVPPAGENPGFSEEQLTELLFEELKQNNSSTKSAVTKISNITGVSKGKLYELAVIMKNNK
ncbi:MAG: 16S rRNA (cytidine(1402)-2'-O)-methyltransferase [Desulfuromonadales bacterium]|nr:16S rRNA (cytidine(1402)-2'-O)-methyltransferase [Desulfuromonadales bacterium]